MYSISRPKVKEELTLEFCIRWSVLIAKQPPRATSWPFLLTIVPEVGQEFKKSSKSKTRSRAKCQVFFRDHVMH